MENQGHLKGKVPTTVPSVAAFVDILGYKEVITDAFKKGKAPGDDELAKLRKALEKAQFWTQQRAIHMPEGLLIRTFSDNLFVAFEIGKGESENEIDVVAWYIGFVQMALAQLGYFVRGAIAIDYLHMDDEFIFGPALLAAFEAEQTEAVFPRIILCKDAVREYDLTRPGSYFVEDRDGYFFLDYLALSRSLFDGAIQGPTFRERLEGHRDMVSGRLAQFRGNPCVQAKYGWVAHYHNRFCGDWQFPETLKIPSDLLETVPAPWQPKVN